ncbi:Phospholipase A1-Ibeta2 [Forsythia ovata]|uniref:Phospholipase A1-Ibeta2 n=1 Tax=Forsythia ovata TaxID=205694 RepID=A0ABD1WEG0_9LAMI
MQIGSTLQAHNLHSFPATAGRSSFRYGGLRPNSFIRLPVQSKHLFNLEKLKFLGKQFESKPSDSDPEPVQKESNNGSLGMKGKGLLDRLKLGRVWPEMKAAEEMSPRHLNRLQRLLSKSPEYSPRNNLGNRWLEYHGRDDWSGLLDPLDENLRREVVRCGEFIQAAYHCFYSNPVTLTNEVTCERHVALPDKSYRTTKSLYATSSIGFPRWVDAVAPDLGWMTQRSSWVGYMAMCEDKREIRRMGRRDIVIALRGTATCLEWAENCRNLLIPIAKENDPTVVQPKVECGFFNLFKTPGTQVPSLAESVVEEVKRLIDKYKGETLSITITGHSLGAALALLVGDELSRCTQSMPPVAIFSFGGPRVGNQGFANSIRSRHVKVLRIVNSQDVITRVPGMFVSEELDKKLRDSNATQLLNVLDNTMPWAYAHVGSELRVDTKMSPYLKANADISCCHDLEAYLHLVDGFLASNCPFRANAKRSLLRLLNEQRSNVKRLHTSKVKNLSLNLERDTMSLFSCLSSPP